MRLLRRGRLLAILTVSWNIVEGIVAVAAGLAAGSIALVGFGIDSFIETTSAIVVGWRLQLEIAADDPERTATAERRAARAAGILLLALAAYIAVDAGRRLAGFGAPASESPVGIGLVAISLVVMPILAAAKFRVAAALNSRALRADAYETMACTWLSLTTLVGLVLTALLGWTWADPLAALAIVPIAVREGLEGLRGRDD